jgi:hypothetical protein
MAHLRYTGAADEKLSAFVELETTIHAYRELI